MTEFVPVEKSSSNGISLDEKIRDKRLYQIGDMTFQGQEIVIIYVCASNFIVYCGKSGSLCWEIDEIPRWAIDAIPQCSRLRGLAESYLSRSRISKVNRLLADSLAASLISSEGSDIAIFFNEAEKYIDKFKDEIKSTIAWGPEFVIYRTKNEGIQWHHQSLPAHLNQAIEEFESLKSLAYSVLPKSYHPAITTMLGSSLSVVFRKSEDDDFNSIFSGAKQFITSHVEAYLRIRLFLVNLLSTLATLFILFLIVSYSEAYKSYVLGVGAGVLGAMVSALQRNNKILIDPYGSILALYGESLSRLVIGIVFGLFVVILSYSELALAPFKDNLYAITCFSFIAGFSERFVPDLMSTVAKKTEIEND